MINSKKQKLIKEEIKEKTIHKLEEAVDISKKFASKKLARPRRRRENFKVFIEKIGAAASPTRKL